MSFFNYVKVFTNKQWLQYLPLTRNSEGSMPVFALGGDLIFPDPCLAEPDGLLAVGGDLRPERIVLAYRNGIFPWYNPGEPILWWSPDPRLVLFPDELHCPRRLMRLMKKRPFHVTYDRAFSRVIRQCKETRQVTWITEEMLDAYLNLHELGIAHSFEAWQDDELVGGLYGIRLGHVFFGESMFTKVSNASKIAFVTAVRFLQEMGVELIDCQVETGHLKRFGARPIERQEFLRLLKRLI